MNMETYSELPFFMKRHLSALFISMVATAVFLFFISKVKWSDDPNFEALDCKYLKLWAMCPHYHHNLLVFVIGTILAISQRKMARLQSWSIKIFIGIWILAVFIISKG